MTARTGNAISRALILGVLLLAPAVFAAPLLAPIAGAPCHEEVAWDGCVLWTARDMPEKGNGAARVEGMTLSADGLTVYTLSRIDRGPLSSFNTDWGVTARDATGGALLWRHDYDGGSLWQDDARAIALTPDGARLLVVGGSTRERIVTEYEGGTRTTSVKDARVMALDAATGALLWAHHWNGGGLDALATAVVVNADGSRAYVATGATGSDSWSPGTDAILTYDVATGTLLHEGLGAPDLSDDRFPLELALAPDESRLYVLGLDFEVALDYGFYVRAVDVTDGAPIWDFNYDTVKSEVAWRFAVDAQRVYVAAHERNLPLSPPTGRDGILALEAGTGTQAWMTWVENTVVRGFTSPLEIAIHPQGGRVYLSGARGGDGANHGYVAAFNATTGARDWLTPHEPSTGGGSESAGIAVTPDGAQIVVTGTDFLTVEYDPVNQRAAAIPHAYVGAMDAHGGEWRWAARLDARNDPLRACEPTQSAECGPDVGGGWSRGMGIAISPYGKTAYVAGEAQDGNAASSVGRDVTLAAIHLTAPRGLDVYGAVP